MTQIYDTTPLMQSPVEADPADPLEGVGTLAQQALRQRDDGRKKRKTKFEIAADSIRGASIASRALKDACRDDGRSMTDSLADVESFSKLIDDREVTFEQLAASFHQDEGFRIVCHNPPPPGVESPDDPTEETSVLSMDATQSFLQCVARYANEKTSKDTRGKNARREIAGLTGTFLRSMTDGSPDAQALASDLLCHVFRRVEKTYTEKDELGDRVCKLVLLRTLRRDLRGRWPKRRSCRAILHAGYRDDISHLWTMRLLADLTPTGRVLRYLFDGDLLKGSILIPDIARVEQDSEYGGGLFFFSGEVGNRKAGLQPFVYRAVSRSVTIMGESWGVTHSTRTDTIDLRRDLEQYVHEQIPLVTTAMDRLIRSQDIQFMEDDPYVVERLLIAVRLSFSAMSQQDLRLWNVGVHAERNFVPGLALSVFTLQNGLTRMSQAIEDVVRQIQLEQMAGKLLDLDWQKIVDRSRTVTDDQVREVFPAAK